MVDAFLRLVLDVSRFTLLSRFAPRAGLVTLRQTFVRCCQNCVGCSHRAASVRLIRQLSAAVPHSCGHARTPNGQPGHTVVGPGWLQLGAQHLPVRHANRHLG
jgi:hypothetical protein